MVFRSTNLKSGAALIPFSWWNDPSSCGSWFWCLEVLGEPLVGGVEWSFGFPLGWQDWWAHKWECLLWYTAMCCRSGERLGQRKINKSENQRNLNSIIIFVIIVTNQETQTSKKVINSVGKGLTTLACFEHISMLLWGCCRCFPNSMAYLVLRVVLLTKPTLSLSQTLRPPHIMTKTPIFHPLLNMLVENTPGWNVWRIRLHDILWVTNEYSVTNLFWMRTLITIRICVVIGPRITLHAWQVNSWTAGHSGTKHAWKKWGVWEE